MPEKQKSFRCYPRKEGTVLSSNGYTELRGGSVLVLFVALAFLYGSSLIWQRYVTLTMCHASPEPGMWTIIGVISTMIAAAYIEIRRMPGLPALLLMLLITQGIQIVSMLGFHCLLP